MLPKLKESMKASGVGIIILNENSFHMSHYGRINSRVFFTKDLQQYLVYKDIHQLYLTLAEALKQLKTMGILEDSTITLSQMPEWAQPLAGIKDHSNTPAETTNAYDADYKKRCLIRGANFHRSKRLKWLNNRLVNLNVDLELARNEASHERVTVLEIEIDIMKADKNELESQTAEQRVAANALHDRAKRAKKEAEEAQRVAKAAERDRKRAKKEAEEEAQRVAKAADRDRKRAEKEAEEEAQRVAKAADRDRKLAEKEGGEEAQRAAKAAAKAAQRDAKWSAEDDASIESMINGGVFFSKIASKLGNGLTETDIKNRWYRELKKSSGITKPPVKTGPHSSITWTADVDATIVRMRTDDISFAKIASKLGKGLKGVDIQNRWNRHLKDTLQ
jgi:chemotaxis protein histidine kinase CheA